MKIDKGSVNVIPLEEGWDEIQTKGIDKLLGQLERNRNGEVKIEFSPAEYIHIYTTSYDMCTQLSPYNWSREVYQRHGDTIECYLTTKVLPALQDKTGQGGTIFLTELDHRWCNHKIMNKWLKKFFFILDGYYIKRHCLPTLSGVGLNSFRFNVFDVVKGDTTAAILGLINEEREGQIIDKTLIKSIVGLYESMDAYMTDLEEPLLTSTRAYYARKREEWIKDCDSTQDYCSKVRKALDEEKNRVADYLSFSSESKILKVVEEELSVADYLDSSSESKSLKVVDEESLEWKSPTSEEVKHVSTAPPPSFWSVCIPISMITCNLIALVLLALVVVVDNEPAASFDYFLLVTGCLEFFILGVFALYWLSKLIYGMKNEENQTHDENVEAGKAAPIHHGVIDMEIGIADDNI